MRASGLAFLLLLPVCAQDSSEVLKRAQQIAAHACDLDPAVRKRAAQEALDLCKEHQEDLESLAEAKKTVASITLALAGKQDAAALFALADRSARLVACDTMNVTKDQIKDLIKLLDEKDLALRLAAARALARLSEPGEQEQVTRAFADALKARYVVEVLFFYIRAVWDPTHSQVQKYLDDTATDKVEAALAAVCNLPELVPSANFTTYATHALANDRVKPELKRLFVRVLGREKPDAALPLLAVTDRRLRSELVDALDAGLTRPSEAQAVYDASNNDDLKRLDDGREKKPKQLLEWFEKWISRLCGEKVTLASYPDYKIRLALEKQVDVAIQRGVEGLRKQAEKDGSWAFRGQYPAKWGYQGTCSVGTTGLVTYTLLKCGVSRRDDAVEKGIDLILDKDPEGTYSAGFIAMALATAIDKSNGGKGSAEFVEKAQKRLQRIADILVASQTRTGGWTYEVNLKTGTGDWSTTTSDYDLSNTQFAILGLRACVNGGAKVPEKTWERALALYERCVRKDGGWGYWKDRDSYNSMTAAGACSWIICKLSLEEKAKPEEVAQSERIRAALKFLETCRNKQGTDGKWDYYWLYSLERCCMNAKAEKIGERDWYGEGVSLLLSAQQNDGTWSGHYGHLVDTCFALLFLRRAYVGLPDTPTESVEKQPKK